MTTTHAAGADSSSVARTHGRRKSPADTRMRAVLLTAKPEVEFTVSLGLASYFRPLLLPGAVVHAVVLAVAAVRHGRLPELDAVEVGTRCVRVVLRARALLDFFHVGASLRVGRRLPEGDRLLGLHLGGGHPIDPLVGAVGVLGLGREHPGVRPTGRSLNGDQI